MRRGAAWLVAMLMLITAGMAVAGSAQLVGTVHETRTAWNPFAAANDMQAANDGGFVRELDLRVDGGRNRDGIYAMRFFVDHELRQVYKRGLKPGSLITGPQSAFAGNIIFRVPANGTYRVRFNPAAARYDITPPVIEQQQIESMQLNGFVHDGEGLVEVFDGRRTHPAEIWDESVAAHELTRHDDGSWSIDLPLTTRGGHQKNGIYKSLLSANHNGDWGFSAIINQPGRLAGGNGYNSRVGHIEESALVFRVLRDATYRLTVWPEQYRFTIDPAVEFFPGASYQVNGDVLPEAWSPEAASHAMEKGAQGLWQKDLELRKNGGAGGSGLYTMNFSITATGRSTVSASVVNGEKPGIRRRRSGTSCSAFLPTEPTASRSIRDVHGSLSIRPSSRLRAYSLCKCAAILNRSAATDRMAGIRSTRSTTCRPTQKEFFSRISG